VLKNPTRTRTSGASGASAASAIACSCPVPVRLLGLSLRLPVHAGVLDDDGDPASRSTTSFQVAASTDAIGGSGSHSASILYLLSMNESLHERTT
jgi:hypothetical protein